MLSRAFSGSLGGAYCNKMQDGETNKTCGGIVYMNR